MEEGHHLRQNWDVAVANIRPGPQGPCHKCFLPNLFQPVVISAQHFLSAVCSSPRCRLLSASREQFPKRLISV